VRGLGATKGPWWGTRGAKPPRNSWIVGFLRFKF